MGATFLCFDSNILTFEVDGRSGSSETLLLILSLLGCTEIFQKSNRTAIVAIAFQTTLTNLL